MFVSIKTETRLSRTPPSHPFLKSHVSANTPLSPDTFTPTVELISNIEFLYAGIHLCIKFKMATISTQLATPLSPTVVS